MKKNKDQVLISLFVIGMLFIIVEIATNIFSLIF